MEQRKNIHNNYLVLKGESEETEHYSIKMILERVVPNILCLEIQRLNNGADYYYDITGLHSIKEYLGKKLLNEDLVKNLLSSVLNQLEIAKEFLLEENDFLFTIESIFVEPLSQKIFFCYKNNYNKDVKKQIQGLIEFFLEHVDYEDKKAVLLVYGLYKKSREDWNCQQLWNIINNTENPCIIKKENNLAENNVLNNISQHELVMNSMTDNVMEKDNTIAENYTNIDNKIKAEKPIENKFYSNHYRLGKENAKREELKKSYSIWVWLGCIASVFTCLGVLVYLTISGFLFNKITGELYLVKLVSSFAIVGTFETIVLNLLLAEKHRSIIKKQKEKDDFIINKKEDRETVFSQEQVNIEEETIVLAKREEIFCLYPFDIMAYEEINIIEFPFFIGKLKSKVNGMIENRTISRYHARIDEEAGSYYITDLNSTNGTFLNGQKLDPNQKEEIKLEDIVAFANVEYKFICK